MTNKKTMKLTKKQIKFWNEPFAINSICRIDLKNYLTDKQIKKLDDSDMKYIAEKMGNDMQENYWLILEFILEDRMNLKLKKCKY